MALPLRWKGRPSRLAALAPIGALAILAGLAVYASRGGPVGAPASILAAAAPAPRAGSSLPPAFFADSDRAHSAEEWAEERQRVLRLMILYGAYGAGARPFGPFR